MPSIQEALQWSKAQLSAFDASEAAFESQLLLAHIVEKPRSYLMAFDEVVIDEGQWQQFQQIIDERKAGKPVAYIIGYQEFWSREFYVNSSTLIPRPDTETLVEWVLESYSNIPTDVLDAGTGSGILAITLKKERPNWQVSACDYSQDALNIAKKNAAKHAAVVNFSRADWLSACQKQSLDLIVSNPPYIAPDDHHLAQLVNEPISALVADEDGLADIKKIIDQAREKLKNGGSLYIEHGFDQALAVQALFEQYGYSGIENKKDLGQQPRITRAIWQA